MRQTVNQGELAVFEACLLIIRHFVGKKVYFAPAGTLLGVSENNFENTLTTTANLLISARLAFFPV